MSYASSIIQGDCRLVLPTLAPKTFHCCVTSPPYYGLRDYDHPEQIGQEDTPGEYVQALVDVFRGVRRALRDDGTLWLNLGDCYAGARGGEQGASGEMATRSAAASNARKRHVTRIAQGLKYKDLFGIPWMVAFALRADGWYLRSDIIWHKPNPTPESVKDRPTKAHEYVFLLSKSGRYFYDYTALAEPCARPVEGNRRVGKHERRSETDPLFRTRANLSRIKPNATRNAHSVWTIATEPYSGSHFAAMPSMLAQRCILAGSPVGGTVLDPFGGSGTVGEVATRLGRNSVMIELNGAYVEELAKVRTAQMGLL